MRPPISATSLSKTKRPSGNRKVGVASGMWLADRGAREQHQTARDHPAPDLAENPPAGRWGGLDRRLLCHVLTWVRPALTSRFEYFDDRAVRLCFARRPSPVAPCLAFKR
jgi:hypothetical protein